MKVGDIVQLKSGGPEMTVGDVEESEVSCVFFDASGQVKELVFKAEMLDAI